MPRGNRIAFPLAFLCFALASCGHAGVKAGRAPARTEPAILVSVFSDAVLLVDPATGARRTIASGLGDYQRGYASWDPKHQRIAYGDGRIVVADPRSGSSWTLVRGRELSMPTWSPDGESMAYGDGISLWMTAVDPPAPYRVAVPAILAPLEMAWSSTGVIAFEGLELDCSMVTRCVSTGSSEIWTILPDGTGLTRLTHLGHAEKPKWSPDGHRLVFVRTYPGTPRRSEAWTMAADGSNPIRILPDEDVVAADWSPDASSLAVVRHGSEPNTLQLWVGRGDGSDLRRVGGPVPGTDATLDW
jgi:WD40-like Beta Propeller Repeat